MVLARRRAEWERIAWLCHVIVNSNPYRDGPAVTPAQCNPLEPDSGMGGTTTGIDCLNPDAVAAYHDALRIREARTR